MLKLPGLVALVFAAASFAASTVRADELTTVDGNVHECKILSVDEDGVNARGTLKTGETVEVKVPVARIDPFCFYLLRDAAIGNDAKARLRFALWAVDQGLFAQAKAQVRKAAKDDPQLVADLQAGKYPEIREKIAMHVLNSAEADMAAGRLDNAREKLNIVLAKLPDTDAGEKARGVFKTLEEKEQQAEAKSEAAAKEKLDEKARKAAEANAKLLASVDEEISKARALATQGFTEDDCQQALELLERALGRAKDAMGKLDAIEKDHADDLALVAESKTRRDKLTAGIVRVRIQRADLYIWRGSLPNAKKELDAAKAIDPMNPAIASAMERLMAANDDDDPLERRETRERRQAGGSRFGGGGRGR